jgi:ring-1,2-phenylacetyl-CoA epoxidase subunit PaaE
MRRQFHRLTVAGIDRLTAESVAVTFSVPAPLGGEFAFRAGQHLTLRRDCDGADVRRSYSICSPEGGPLRVAIKAVPSGVFSSYALAGLGVGDEVEVLPPLGTFTLGAEPEAHYGFVAAGSGITPVFSLAATALARGSACTLVYGNRGSASVMFLDELADLKDRYPTRFQLIHVLSQEAGALAPGRLSADSLQRILKGAVPFGEIGAWYLCGPYGLVTMASEVLAALGAPAVHTELFFVEESPPAVTSAIPAAEANSSKVLVRLDGRESLVDVSPGERILDAALRIRPELPFACKGGVCSTCRAKVTDGEVRMDRNYALEPSELAAGYVLTCQSHPVTAELTVDYDA